MFGMGMPEIIVILAVALIVLGPKKLPEIAKSLGRGIAEFKKATQEFKENIDVDNDLREARDTLREVKDDLEDTVRKSVTETAKQEPDAVADYDLEHAVENDATKPAGEPAEDKPEKDSGLKDPASNG
ncbi:MAG: twin-arginine translocase TatA/TatE family subunit [Deltaproteobacteria bacterium]|nr:twin-arginine translocase TatA/TatE family subunit [Deltaproteobacteria bacterium]